MSRFEVLGEQKFVELSQGRLGYRERGTGQPMVFIHGLVLNGDVWRKVVPELSQDFRCLTPDLPLGSHETLFNLQADLTPPGLARLIADFMEALDLHDVILVGVDTGGAFCQLTVTNHPERLGGLVLTNCDAFENFLPPLLAPFQWAAYLPDSLSGLGQLLRWRPFQRLFFGLTVKHPIEQAAVDSYAGPFIRSKAVRRDVTKVLKGISKRYTLEAARKFPQFNKPVLIVWGKQDLFFTTRYARRLAQAFPQARLELVENCRTFVAEDQPTRLVELIQNNLRGVPTAAF